VHFFVGLDVRLRTAERLQVGVDLSFFRVQHNITKWANTKDFVNIFRYLLKCCFYFASRAFYNAFVKEEGALKVASLVSGLK